MFVGTSMIACTAHGLLLLTFPFLISSLFSSAVCANLLWLTFLHIFQANHVDWKTYHFALDWRVKARARWIDMDLAMSTVHIPSFSGLPRFIHCYSIDIWNMRTTNFPRIMTAHMNRCYCHCWKIIWLHIVQKNERKNCNFLYNGRHFDYLNRDKSLNPAQSESVHSIFIVRGHCEQ